MQAFDSGLLCSSFLSSHCKAYDIISLVDVINPNSKWGSCSVQTAGNLFTLYPKKVNTLSLLQIIPSQVKVTLFVEFYYKYLNVYNCIMYLIIVCDYTCDVYIYMYCVQDF